jgi:hypothetical protein
MAKVLVAYVVNTEGIIQMSPPRELDRPDGVDVIVKPADEGRGENWTVSDGTRTVPFTYDRSNQDLGRSLALVGWGAFNRD